MPSGSRASCASARATAASSDGAVTVSRSSAWRVARTSSRRRVDEPLGLGPGRPDRLVPLAPRAAALLVGGPQGLGRARLGGPRPVERLARLALGLADPGERLLERALVLGQARAGVGDDPGVEPEPLGDRERLAAAGQPDRQLVGRRERLEVELDRGVPGAAGRVGVGLELGVVGRRRDERAGLDEVVEEGLGERRALGRVGAGAELVEEDERARARPPRRSG